MEIVPIDIQYFTMIVCSCLSVLGSGYIIVSSMLIPRPKPFYLRIVLFISVSDAIRSIVFMIPCNKLDSEVLIVLFAILNDSSFLITILWSTYISIILYLVVVKSKAEFNKDFKYWSVTSFILIPLLNFLPISTKSHGCSSTICTLSNSLTGEIWRSCLLYAPGWVLIIVSVCACIAINIEIQKLDLDEIQKFLVKKLIFYPVILIIEVLPMSICSLLAFLDLLDNSSVPAVVSTTVFALHGASNSIVYAMTLDKHRGSNSSVMSRNIVLTAKVDTNEFSTDNLLFGTFSATSEISTR